MVMLPTRGSRNSRRSSSLRERWIWPSTRRPRCGSRDIRLDRRECDRRPAPIAISLKRSGYFHARVALDLVAHAHVVVVLHADAALGTGTHFAHVVLEAPQRFERPFEDHHVVAQHADRVV